VINQREEWTAQPLNVQEPAPSPASFSTVLEIDRHRMIPRHMMHRFGCAVELGKKLHENLAKMTCKSKITTGKRGSILPSLEDRIEQAMRYATKSVQKREAIPMTQNPEESPIHGEVTHLNPETLHKNPAFTQVITVTGPAKTIYIGGQDAVDAQGNIAQR
jgi:hypothetical protein